MSDDQVAVPPPSLEEPPCEHRIVDAWIVEGTEPEQVAMWGCRFCRIRFYPHDNVDRALLTRQEALEARIAALHRVAKKADGRIKDAYGAAMDEQCGDVMAALDEAREWLDALLDASQSVKPPTLPEPDLRLMGEAVKGGKYPEQPVKP